ncbi:MAG: M48 family metallopeptidase [Gemmatimonadales bacterium]
MNEDKATRYNRQKRQASLGSLLWTAALLFGLVASGLSVTLRHIAEALAARVVSPFWLPGATVLSYVALLTLLNELGSLPIGFYSGFLLERRYALSTQTLGGWIGDRAKSLAIGLMLGAAGAGAVYWLIRRSPEWWWLEAGLLFALVIIALTNLAPVVLLPLFYAVKPLDREALSRRLLALADRAGARVLGAYEWGLGGKTKKANAALTGLGATRRILVSDTMLAEYTDDEIEVVLAHELAHHVHGDIWKGIVFESVLLLAGFDLAALVLRALAGPLGLRGVDDVAGLPLLLLAAGAVSLVMLPVAHAMSRAFERSADRFALALTRNPAAFISAMRRLGAQNLAEEHPSRLVQWLFYSHPPVRERIAAAQTFKA